MEWESPPYLQICCSDLYHRETTVQDYLHDGFCFDFGVDNCAFTAREQASLTGFLQAVTAQHGLAEPCWELSSQFERSGSPLTFEEREALLVRSHHVFVGQGSEFLCPERAHYLCEYVKKEKGTLALEEEFHAYPWYDLEEELRADPGRRIQLFGFGSLVNPQSASYNLRRRVGPAIAFGLKRVFNYQDHFLHSCNVGCPAPGYPHEQAKLNAALADDPTHLINGIIYEVDAEDLVRLRPRERGYDLEKLHVVDYIDAQDPHCKRPRIIETYFLRATSDHQTSTRNLPDINYLNVCAEGVRPYGSAFARLFLDTTYLSDGTTPLSHWLMSQIRDLALTEAQHQQMCRLGHAVERVGRSPVQERYGPAATINGSRREPSMSPHIDQVSRQALATWQARCQQRLPRCR